MTLNFFTKKKKKKLLIFLMKIKIFLYFHILRILVLNFK
jgi:hypothetical protein